MVNFERWQNKDVILDVNVSRDDTKDVLVDRIQIKTRLPYPINDVKKIDVQENYKSNCGQFFCLGVLIYAWCDDVIACAGPRPTSSSSVLPTTSFPKETSSFTSLTASQSFFKSSQAVNQPFQAAPKEHPNVNPTKSYETRSWDKTSSRSKTTKQPAVPRAGEARGNDETQHWWVWVGIAFLIVLFLVVVTGFVFLRIKRRSKAKKAKISVELKKTEAKENYGFSGSM
ncbi:uncharacterized protein LOC114516815 isoform X2 [Dendronephthya gigantea]|nr:uncharacterized protein LOC114516815 isoform X2 [Dendronephthya gigantea]